MCKQQSNGEPMYVHGFGIEPRQRSWPNEIVAQPKITAESVGEGFDQQG